MLIRSCSRFGFLVGLSASFALATSVHSTIALPATLPVVEAEGLFNRSRSTVEKALVALTDTHLIAQKSRTQKVQFAPGKTSTKIKTAVLRGTRDIYLLGAKQGQTMTVKIASLENNAVFDVATPPNRTGQRRILKREAGSWSGKLPESGEYQIIVGTTRGNASYELQISIK